MYAVVKIEGFQYRLKKGDRIDVPKLNFKEGTKVQFDNVLLFSDGENILIGNPVVDNVKIDARVIAHGKAEKITIFKKKRRKGYRKKMGHRQEYTKIQIEDIIFSKPRVAKKTKKKAVKEIAHGS